MNGSKLFSLALLGLGITILCGCTTSYDMAHRYKRDKTPAPEETAEPSRTESLGVSLKQDVNKADLKQPEVSAPQHEPPVAEVTEAPLATEIPPIVKEDTAEPVATVTPVSEAAAIDVDDTKNEPAPPPVPQKEIPPVEVQDVDVETANEAPLVEVPKVEPESESETLPVLTDDIEQSEPVVPSVSKPTLPVVPAIPPEASQPVEEPVAGDSGDTDTEPAPPPVPQN